MKRIILSVRHAKSVGGTQSTARQQEHGGEKCGRHVRDHREFPGWQVREQEQNQDADRNHDLSPEVSCRAVGP